jgi:starch synthase
MKLLLASSEVHPFSKTGGLADMVGALAKTLAQAGHRVGLVTPLYAGIREKFPKLKKLPTPLDLPLGQQSIHADVWTLDVTKQLTIYFVEQPEFFSRAGIYGEHGGEYWDNGARYIFFSKCVAHLARHLPWQPELVHVHDWQVALVPLFIRAAELNDGWWHAPRTCLTIHNLAYQGNFPAETFALTNLPPSFFNPHAAEFFGKFSCLKTGIVFADAITTVSPRYAREIMTPAYGCGLDAALRHRRESVFGILNGVDYSEWKTSRNPFLKHSFTVKNLRGKAAEKADLQRELGLPLRPDAPLFASITRLADQKGVDLVLAALQDKLAHDLQFVLLGSGSPFFEQAYRELAAKFPDKVAVRIGYNHGLSHRIEAGADFFLMPSRYEPCGLNQMYSLRYGTIPLVRATGGLDDSVTDDNSAAANGLKFPDFSAAALGSTMERALELFRDAPTFHQRRLNAMRADFSWARTREQYEQIFALACDRL